MNPKQIPVGIVGLGLMGSSIVTCLLLAKHPVIAVAPISDDLQLAPQRIRDHLEKSFAHGLTECEPEHYLSNLVITQDYSSLLPTRLVIECTIEDIEVKSSVFEKVEATVAPETLLASNTSAIPISRLQKLLKFPSRFFGLHWAEPAHTTRFLEVICGDESDLSRGEYLYELAHFWQKEPILVRKDIAGFITNRLMYAMYREAMHLVEQGYASVEDVDRSCRNNAGYFMTFVGIFRWMDLTGVQAYHTVMKDLFPTLTNGTSVPALINDIVDHGGRGVSNGLGFYRYEDGEAKMWEEAFSEFTYEIRNLALKYSENYVKNKLSSISD